VLVHQDDWYLFYERRDAGIWLAKASMSSDPNPSSPALPVWQNVQDDPVMGLNDRDYDRTMIALNQVVPVSDGYLAMFHSSSDAESPRRWVCSAAFSRDLVHWVKLDQPLTDKEQNRSSGQLVDGPSGWRFYTTHGQVTVDELKEPIQ
jgi:phosphoglucomutase